MCSWILLNSSLSLTEVVRSFFYLFIFFLVLLSLTRSAEKLAMDFLYEIFHISSIFSWADANYIEHISDKYIYKRDRIHL